MKMNIYVVTTCKFTKSKASHGVYKLDVDQYVDRYCVLDIKRGLAIDINTHEQFYRLSKTENNQIDKNERIDLGKEYAVNVRSLDLSTLSKREFKKLKFAYIRFVLRTNYLGVQPIQPQNVIKR